jgi:hypothetical protein
MLGSRGRSILAGVSLIDVGQRDRLPGYRKLAESPPLKGVGFRLIFCNDRLTFDWRYERPEDLASDAQFRGNSGLLVHIAQPHKVWPRCVEIQLMNADAGHIFAIGGAKFQGRKDAAAQRTAIKTVGEWNHEEVTCRDGAISCEINGSLVDKGTGAMPDRGPIGWQSEGG